LDLNLDFFELFYSRMDFRLGITTIL
jgi:hypothetical protein